LIIEQYELDGDFEDVFVKCKEVSSWNKIVMNDGYLSELTAYAFQLVPVIFCFCWKRMEVVW
jgi:hypothetical protein